MTISEEVAARLSPVLGEFNAAVWVKTVSERRLSRPVSELSGADLPALLEGLRPSLNTFLGREAAGRLLQRIAREVT
ncbi:MAG TPA: hypothetical protein VHM02_06730 [Thermoanaerobaculia bacterium]|nr:hypothetical protein [Thermoanaerobaculia bacterium]